jgi:hypothetical protein
MVSLMLATHIPVSQLEQEGEAVIWTAAQMLWPPGEPEPGLEPTRGTYVHEDYGSKDDATLHELGL